MQSLLINESRQQTSFKIIIRLPMPALLTQNSPLQKRCCICFSFNCSESVDHEPIHFQSLSALIQSSKRNQHAVDAAKQSLTQKYTRIRDEFCKKVQEDEQIFQEWLNQFYFTHITDRINRPLLCQIAQANHSQLPSKSLPKLIKILRKYQHSDATSNDLPSSFQDAVRFLERIDVQSLTEKPIRLLGVQRVVKIGSELLSLASKKSLSEIYDSEECELYPEVYEWKAVRINRNSRTAQLSNKNLRDEDVIREIPRIGCFKNIRQLEIRNNCITALSCKIIVNNMGFLQCLDIRGNKVGDKGLEHIILGMPHLKSLMISETGATDKSGRLIAEHMDNLELFWAEHNHLSGQVILAIGSKPKVKVMSVAGNQIEQRYSSLLHGLFVRKGYIVL